MNDTLLLSQVALWIVVAGLMAVALALARQVALLHERIVPSTLGASGGELAIGETAPRLRARDLAGRSIQLGGEHPERRSTLLLFVSPHCPVCKDLLPVAASGHRGRDSARPLDLVLVGDGERGELDRLVREHRLRDVPFLVGFEIGPAFGVSRLPYAVLLDGAGVVRAKGVLGERRALERLLAGEEARST